MIAVIKTLLDRLSLWMSRARTRRQLQDLPPYMLADIGLDAAARDEECAKWAWQGPTLSIEQAHAKENGRCLRAPVSNFRSIGA